MYGCILASLINRSLHKKHLQHHLPRHRPSSNFDAHITFYLCLFTPLSYIITAFCIFTYIIPSCPSYVIYMQNHCRLLVAIVMHWTQIRRWLVCALAGQLCDIPTPVLAQHYQAVQHLTLKTVTDTKHQWRKCASCSGPAALWRVKRDAAHEQTQSSQCLPQWPHWGIASHCRSWLLTWGCTPGLLAQYAALTAHCA